MNLNHNNHHHHHNNENDDVPVVSSCPTVVTAPQHRPTLERGTMGRLSITGEGMNFDIPSNIGQKEHIIQAHGHSSWRLRVIHIIHSKTIEYILAALLFLDILLLFAELLLLSYFPHCTLIIRDAISCCSSSISSNSSNIESNVHNDTTSHLLVRFLESVVTNDAETHEEHEEICAYPSRIEDDMSYPAGCDEHRHSGAHLVEEILFYLTIGILSIFMIELNCAMIALTPSIFFRQFFFALDYIIITISIVLEITFHVLSDTLYQSLSGLLVIFRIWRFIRIGHGIVELTNEAAHREYDKLVEYTKELRMIISSTDGISLPTNHPEMELFFTNYDHVHNDHPMNHSKGIEGPIIPEDDVLVKLDGDIPEHVSK